MNVHTKIHLTRLLFVLINELMLSIHATMNGYTKIHPTTVGRDV